MTAKPDYGPGTPNDPFPEYVTPDEAGDLTDTGSITDAIDAHKADVSDPHADAAYASDTDISDAIDTHAAADDPHTTYTKQAEVDSSVSDHDADVLAHIAAGFAVPTDISDAITDHEGAADPHTTYETSAEVDTKVATHAADTSSVHGITDTTILETTTGTTSAISSHSASTDPHGDRAYADGVASGLTVKDSVVAATTANITLSGAQTIDGVAVVAGNRVLVKDQTTTKNNGIYVAASSTWARATDADTTGEMKVGSFAYVQSGTVNGTASYVCNSAGTLDTDPVLWTQFNQAGSVSAGAGLLKTGSVIDLVNGGGLTIAADSVTVASNHGGSTHATATTNATNVSYPVVRPEAYSAVGDGSTDDSTALANAVAAIPSTGGTLALAPGAVYKLTAPSKTITAATYTGGSTNTVTFTSASHGYLAGDLINVLDVVSTGAGSGGTYNQVWLAKTVTTDTITCYADHVVNPGTYSSGGLAVGVGLYIRDKAGVTIQGAAARTQGSAAGGSWFSAGTRGMILVAAQKTTGTTMTHSGPNVRDVGFIDTAFDVNLQTGCTAAWSAGTITFTKTSHGFSTNDVVHVFNSGNAAFDTTTSYTVTRVDANSFTAPLVADPGAATTSSVAYETLPSAKSARSVGLCITGCTRSFIERVAYSGLKFGHILHTANNKDTSWSKLHACVWQDCAVGFKIFGDGGQSVYIDGGNLIMHTGQVGFQGPNPEQTNDANHFRCTGMKFDTQYTSGAGCMGFDIGLALYLYIGHCSFEMEGTSTTRCVRAGTTSSTHGSIVGLNCQHNDGGSGSIDATAIEIVGTSATNPAGISVLGGHTTNFKESVHIGPYSLGSNVIGLTQSASSSGSTVIKVHDATTCFGTVLVGVTSQRKGSSATLLSIPSGSDTRWIACWDYGNGTPKWYTDGQIQQKAGAPSNTAGGEFPQFHDGQMQLDTTNHRLYIRDGATWKYAALT